MNKVEAFEIRGRKEPIDLMTVVFKS